MNVFIRRLNKAVEVSWDDLPKVSQEYIINYGLTQTLNDCHASAEDDADAEAKVKARLDRLIAGNPPEVGAKSDPVTAAAREIIVNMLRSTGMKASEARKSASGTIEDGLIKVLVRKKVDAKKIPEAVKLNLPIIEAEAKRVVEATKVSVELTLG